LEKNLNNFGEVGERLGKSLKPGVPNFNPPGKEHFFYEITARGHF